MKTIAFFDLEVNPRSHHILDIGCVKSNEAVFHDKSIFSFLEFVKGVDFICGHNIFKHDLLYLQKQAGVQALNAIGAIDTLFLSPLLFPSHPYHRLLKDDKLQVEELNNPLNDSKKARDLFYDEVAAFSALDESLKCIYFNLLHQHKEFSSFFSFVGYHNALSSQELENVIWQTFDHKICQNANLSHLITNSPVSLAYTLALINITDRYSITPPWVLHTFPDVDRVMFNLRNTPCVTGCS